MDRNVFVAIALSMSVLLFWGAFFEAPKKPSEQVGKNLHLFPNNGEIKYWYILIMKIRIFVILFP